MDKGIAGRGFSVSERYVARLMNSQGINALKHRTYHATTDSNHSCSIARDYVKRDFNPTGPNQFWGSDLTYARVGHRWTYLTIVMDLWRRKIVGWSFSRTMKTHEINVERTSASGQCTTWLPKCRIESSSTMSKCMPIKTPRPLEQANHLSQVPKFPSTIFWHPLADGLPKGLVRLDPPFLANA